MRDTKAAVGVADVRLKNPTFREVRQNPYSPSGLQPSIVGGASTITRYVVLRAAKWVFRRDKTARTRCRGGANPLTPIRRELNMCFHFSQSFSPHAGYPLSACSPGMT